MKNEVCCFCQIESETLHHLFLDCVYVQRFWTDFSSFLDSKDMRLPREWKETDNLFGALKYDTVINLLILKTKLFICKKTMDAFIPIFNQFVLSIRYYNQIERYNAVKNSKSLTSYGPLQGFNKLIIKDCFMSQNLANCFVQCISSNASDSFSVPVL